MRNLRNLIWRGWLDPEIQNSQKFWMDVEKVPELLNDAEWCWKNVAATTQDLLFQLYPLWSSKSFSRVPSPSHKTRGETWWSFEWSLLSFYGRWTDEESDEMKLMMCTICNLRCVYRLYLQVRCVLEMGVIKININKGKNGYALLQLVQNLPSF